MITNFIIYGQNYNLFALIFILIILVVAFLICIEISKYHELYISEKTQK
jgi:hypothetical protein